MAKISISLSEKSIDDAIKELRRYKEALPQKLKTVRDRVADEIVMEAKTGFNGEIYDDIIHQGMSVPDVQVSKEEKENATDVVAHGIEAVFVEFGAGVYYNSGGSDHPNRPPNVEAIGEYGYGYGKRKVWGFYEGGKTDDPEENKRRLRITRGTPASMPMYNAAQSVRKRVPEIAKEVFEKR